MAGKRESDGLADLGRRLAAARARHAPKEETGRIGPGQAQLVWRMVIELVAGLAIGFGIGYGLDRWLGTAPFLMVVFTLLGFAAGVKTMLRSAREIQAEAARRAADEGD